MLSDVIGTATRRQWLGGAAAAASVGALLPAASCRAQGAVAWPAVTQLVNRYVAGRRVANMVAALAFGQAEPRFIAAGVDTLGQPRESDATSIYRIYSMTKPITAMAAMMLIDAGKMALDQPVHEILPAFRAMKVQKTYDGAITPANLEPAVRPITIRHLLTHTSGLGYGIVQRGPIAQAYRDRGLVPGLISRIQMLPMFRGTAVPSLALFADRLAELPLVYQPGTRWSYSMGPDLMGRVIEVVADQPFERFVQDRLLGPLGMADTRFQLPRKDAGRMTTSYFAAGETLLPIDLGNDSIFGDKPPFAFGGAGLVSTPRDYDRFLRMVVNHGLLGRKRVMSERAVRIGTGNLLPATLVVGRGGPGPFGAGGRIGSGPDAGTYGWTGAASTVGFVHFPRGLRAGLYTQLIVDGQAALVGEFQAAVRADLAAMGRA